MKLLMCVCILLVQVAPTIARDITCQECKNLEKSRKEAQDELTQRRKELQEALSESNIPKAKTVRDAVDALKNKIRGMEGEMKPCKDACRPDRVKQDECLGIMREIVEMEPQGDTEKVDARYRDLAKCNAELRKLLKRND
jgi:hypothetical protein